MYAYVGESNRIRTVPKYRHSRYKNRVRYNINTTNKDNSKKIII